MIFLKWHDTQGLLYPLSSALTGFVLLVFNAFLAISVYIFFLAAVYGKSDIKSFFYSLNINCLLTVCRHFARCLGYNDESDTFPVHSKFIIIVKWGLLTLCYYFKVIFNLHFVF